MTPKGRSKRAGRAGIYPSGWQSGSAVSEDAQMKRNNDGRQRRSAGAEIVLV